MFKYTNNNNEDHSHEHILSAQLLYEQDSTVFLSCRSGHRTCCTFRV